MMQGPPRWRGPDVLLRQTSFRALSEPRRFRETDGSVVDATLRVRFGEVESRGVALTLEGRRRYDAAMATPDPATAWGDYFPSSHERMARRPGLLPRRRPVETRCLRGFPARFSAGIFRSNLDTDAQEAIGEEDRARDYSVDWLAGQIGHHIHDPYHLYEKVASQ